MPQQKLKATPVLDYCNATPANVSASRYMRGLTTLRTERQVVIDGPTKSFGQRGQCLGFIGYYIDQALNHAVERAGFDVIFDRPKIASMFKGLIVAHGFTPTAGLRHSPCGFGGGHVSQDVADLVLRHI